jgi:hypothetical protein
MGLCDPAMGIEFLACKVMNNLRGLGGAEKADKGTVSEET